MSLAEANRNYFDAISDSYDSKPWFAKVNQQVTDELRARLDWIGIPFANTASTSHVQAVRFLDYACGPGAMSRTFGPYVTVTRGIDLSPNMVATYNARAQAAGFPTTVINAVVGDAFAKDQSPSTELSTPEFWDFDLAAVGFGFHHFEDVVHAARRLKDRLRPGGVLVITDFLEGGDLRADEQGKPIPGTEGNHAHHHHHPGHHQHHQHGHGHDELVHSHDLGHNEAKTQQIRQKMKDSIVVYSFTVEGVKQFFTEAGFVDVDVVVMPERVYMEFSGQKIWRTILIAKGRRPSESEKSEL